VWPERLVVLLSRRVCSKNHNPISLAVDRFTGMGHLSMGKGPRSAISLDARPLPRLQRVRSRQPDRYWHSLLLAGLFVHLHIDGRLTGARTSIPETSSGSAVSGDCDDCMDWS